MLNFLVYWLEDYFVGSLACLPILTGKGHIKVGFDSLHLKPSVVSGTSWSLQTVYNFSQSL